MGRFETTVAYYERARPPYGAVFFAEVARRLDFSRSTRVLDVGAGPGILAIGFARFCGEIVGVDPEPAMIAAARETAGRAGVAARFIEARFEDLPEDLGRFDVATIGRAIHWLDPPAARAALDRLLAPRGRVLVCHAGSVMDGRNAWLDAYEAVRHRWSAPPPPHDLKGFFAGARFAPQETISVETLFATPIDRLADRVLSMSTSSPERLGENVPAMQSAMREALAPFAVDGAVVDIVEARAEVFASVG
jgi:SAM-dependent methyltransferase